MNNLPQSKAVKDFRKIKNMFQAIQKSLGKWKSLYKVFSQAFI